MKLNLANIIKVLVFTSLGILILYFLYRNQNAKFIEECNFKGIPMADCSLLNKLYEDFRSVKLLWIFAILIIFMLSNIFRALRWNQLLRSVGEKPRLVNSLGAIMIGYFSNLAVPRIGEFIKVGVVSKYDNMSFDKVMGTIVIDRLVDFIYFGIFVALGFLVSFELFEAYFKENFSYSANQVFMGLLTLIAFGLVGLFIAYNFVYKKINKESHPFLIKIRNIVEGFIMGLKSVLNLESPGLFWIYSTGIWVCYYLMTFLCFFSFAPTAHLGLKEALIVFVFGTLGMIIPTPGGVGSYQYLVHKSLVILGIGGIAAFSFANILFFSISILCNILFGLFFLILLPIYNSDRQ